MLNVSTLATTSKIIDVSTSNMNNAEMNSNHAYKINKGGNIFVLYVRNVLHYVFYIYLL